MLIIHGDYLYKKAFSAAVLWMIMASGAQAEQIDLGQQLRFEEGSKHEFREIDGRNALCLNGTALVKGLELREGSISVDVANNQHRHFAHLLFHASDFNNSESGYLRMHKSGFPDAVQYTPYIRGESHWQLLSANQMRAVYGDKPWVNLRIDFTEDRARIKVGNGRHVMMVDHLRSADRTAALVGLETLFEGCFSNLQVFGDTPVFDKTAKAIIAEQGAIQTWQLSDVQPFETFPDSFSDLDNASGWSVARTDEDGLLFISRYRSKRKSGSFEGNGDDVVYAKAVITAQEAGSVAFSFDVSDKGAVYLNGTKLFTVNNSFRAKGPLFRGDFDSNQQTIFLPLQKGRNELVIGVAERANGWGLAGALKVTAGIALLAASD